MRSTMFAPMLALLSILAAGCASHKPTPDATTTDPRSPQLVTVSNDNWLDVAVYLVNGGMKVRIGTVNSHTTKTLRTRLLSPASPVQLMIDPIGATAGHLTDAVVVMPGQRIELRVGPQLSISTIAVWNP